MRPILSLLLAGLLLAQLTPAQAQDPQKDPLLKGLAPGLYARFETNFGTMIWRLHHRRAPSAVYNFIGLSEGTLAWTDPKTKEKKKSRFYDGMKIHRIAPGMLIQAGCPVGNGSAGPGYTFAREVDPSLRQDAAGVVSMLTTQEGSSHGSQFFITLQASPKLDGVYTIFAKVIRGRDVLEEIGAVDIFPNQSPKRPVIIKTVKIVRVGDEARKWDPAKAALKDIPAPKAKADPSRLFKPLAKAEAELSVQLIVIHYQGLDNAELFCPYNKAQAKTLADKIAALARQPGADFTALEKRFSDEATGGNTIRLRRQSKRLANMFGPAFKLGVGQVSDPFDLPLGWCVLYRPKTVMARHILIAWKDGPYKDVTRSKDEARAIALDVRRKLSSGKDFGDLLGEFHDPLKVKQAPRGRSRGQSSWFAAHEFAPIGPTAFKLKPGEISEPVEGKDGFYIVQRVQPITVRHILIGWRGNRRVPGVKRSKLEAKELITKILAKLNKGAPFSELLSLSDDKITPEGVFDGIAPEYMVKEFSQAAFALKVGERTGIIESPYGFHIIERLR